MARPVFALLILVLTSSAALAQDDSEDRRKSDRRGPPEAALEACAAAVQGDTCSFEGRRGEAREGTCEAPEEKPLACRPEGGKRDKLIETDDV